MKHQKQEVAMNNFTYSIPTKIHFGKGQISHLSELSESGNKVLLCYGGGSIKKAGIYDGSQDFKRRRYGNF
jgi:alcohol dehydrogenase YqhD (iron-dependent ADH family)